jgi:hypothetical protein
VLLPSDAAFEERRRTFNAMLDRRPRLIVRPVDTGDVVEAVRWATANDLPISVRGGGHNVAGHAVGHDALMIDRSDAPTPRTASASMPISRPLESGSYAVAVTQEEGGLEDGARTCAWCGTPESAAAATTCSSCGAALAQRESIGELAIPGLTSVDAALQDYDKRPIHLRGPSPSQGMAPAVIVGAMAGGPIGLAAIGGVAAVAAAEYLGARRPGAAEREDIGKPSEVALQAIERIEAGSLASHDSDTEAGEAGDAATDAALTGEGSSIWGDLPPVAREWERFEDNGQHEEDGADGR